MLRFNTPITPMTTAVTEIVELHLHYLSALLHSQRYSCVDLTNAVHVASMNVLVFSVTNPCPHRMGLRLVGLDCPCH